MVKKKSMSKRMPMKLKFVIAKRVKAHNKKLAKIARQNPNKRKKVTKDPGIPNLWPYKEKLLETAERQRMKITEEQARQKEARRRAVEKKRAELQQARASTPVAATGRELKGNTKDQQRKKWFMRELKRVLEASDVVLEVLDARDPQGCRSQILERMVLGKYSAEAGRPKRIILVLNKIDLVPPEVVEQWLKRLRREFHCVAFKASTQRNGIGHSVHKFDGHAGGATCIGAGALLEALKQYSLSLGQKTAITVGVVGYPNVGKSSLINSLKRSKVAGVAPTPGFTKNVQLVRLDSHIQLLDSPGVLVEATTGSEDAEAQLVLRNCIKVESVEDPVGAVHAILKRCSPVHLMQVYHIPRFQQADEFLYLIAQKLHKLKKGGVPDQEAAARAVLRDWNQGKIPYYTTPAAALAEVVREDDVSIVRSWGQELNLDNLFDESNAQAVQHTQSMANPSAVFLPMTVSGATSMSLDGQVGSGDVMFPTDVLQVPQEEAMESMDVDSEAKAQPQFHFHTIAKPQRVAEVDVPEKVLDPSSQRNRAIRQKQKKERKARRKQAESVRDTGGGGMDEREDEAAVDTSAPYDFGADWHE